MTATRSEPSKGTLRAAELIALDNPDVSDKNLGVVIRQLGQIIDRETKAGEMAELLARIIESANDGRECPEWLRERLQPVERLLSELEGKG